MSFMRASSVSVVGFRIVAITFQPLLAKSLVAALPMPDDVPVIKTVFFILAISS
jgi:hypothetical protein